MRKSKNDKMVEILRLLKPQMHGAVVEAMEFRGVKYGLNYGVAVPVIREAARRYAPDPELAEYLFRQDVRELKLAAVYIGNPGSVTAEQMNRWAGRMPADEIMEHAAMHLFYASPDADEVIREWLSGSDPFRWKGALQMIGRRAMKGLADEPKGNLYLTDMEKFLSLNDPPQRSTVFALCRLAQLSEGVKEQVQDLAERLRLSDRLPLQEIAEETKAFLAY